MVFFLTMFFPLLIDTVLEKAGHLVSDVSTIETAVANFFPDELRSNMGVLSSDIMIFYGLVVILVVYNLAAKEATEGRWIFPVISGYKPITLVLSKGLVYGVGAAAPSFVFYNLYFFVGKIYLEPNYEFSVSFANSLVMCVAIFFIVFLTAMLSTIYKRPTVAAGTMILFVAVAPDIFSLFSFGKYLPTYILTHLYQSSANFLAIIIPMVGLVSLAILFLVIASKRVGLIEVAR
jgi:hypothetical protein